MSAVLDNLRNWFYGRKPNEQILILLGGLALVYTLADNLLITPMTAYHKKMKDTTDKQFRSTEKMRSELANLYRDDPEIVRKQLLEKLGETQARLTVEEKATLETEKSLVGPRQIMDVLGGMLQVHPSVSIQHIENLPVISLKKSVQDAKKADDAKKVEESKKADDPKKKDLITKVLESQGEDQAAAESGEDIAVADQEVFRHSIRVTLRGKYVDIIRYLQAVETLPWRIFWDELSLEANDYPRALVTVEFHTLSTDEAWFKVS